MLTLENVRVQFGSKVALDLKSKVKIENGDKVGLVGSNGAGKSTLINAVLGLVSYSGSIEKSINTRDIAVHLQQNEYVEYMKVEHIMELVLGCSVKKHAKAMELVRFFDFEDSLKKKFKALSGGQKQRMTLILVICQNSPLTIYDEVTSGLDFETRQRLMDLLSSWYSGSSDTLVIVSHYYEELERLADKLLILDEGKLVDYGKKNELFEKYCGKLVILADRNAFTEKLAALHPTLVGKGDRLAFRCDGDADEERITGALREQNIDYIRTHSDIELTIINAKACRKEGGIK